MINNFAIEIKNFIYLQIFYNYLHKGTFMKKLIKKLMTYLHTYEDDYTFTRRMLTQKDVK